MLERPILVFDVNETLLNLDAIRPIFDRIFNDPAAMRLWFAGLITYSMGSGCIACHAWDTLGAAAASWQAGLILREGNAPLGVGPQPDYIGKDLDVIADQLIQRYPAVAAASQPGH
jgi:hypothetical protein